MNQTTPPTASDAPICSVIIDDFRGDDALLRECIQALIRLNDKDALIPHGIGGHARCLLAASYHRLGRVNRVPMLSRVMTFVFGGMAGTLIILSAADFYLGHWWTGIGAMAVAAVLFIVSCIFPQNVKPSRRAE